LATYCFNNSNIVLVESNPLLMYTVKLDLLFAVLLYSAQYSHLIICFERNPRGERGKFVRIHGAKISTKMGKTIIRSASLLRSKRITR